MTDPKPPLACTAAARQNQKDWFTGFRQRVLTDDEPYVIASAVAPHEVFHTMDVPVVSVPWYSAVISAKQLSPYYFSLMDEMGFHEGLPRYDTLPYFSTLDGDADRAPYGGLPKPALIVERLRSDHAQRHRAERPEPPRHHHGRPVGPRQVRPARAGAPRGVHNA